MHPLALFALGGAIAVAINEAMKPKEPEKPAPKPRKKKKPKKVAKVVPIPDNDPEPSPEPKPDEQVVTPSPDSVDDLGSSGDGVPTGD